jgi:ribosome recycling factor
MDLNEVRAKMAQAIEHLKGELAQIRTGRANSTLVSDIVCDAYDSKMMVKELANISTPEPHVILITPWDKAVITNIAGGITRANVGLNPIVDGDLIKISIPPLTAERREEFIKQMHQTLEKYKVQIRQVRHEFVETVKKQKEAGEVSEDDAVRQQEAIQKLHDEYVEAVEVAGKGKEAELREI